MLEQELERSRCDVRRRHALILPIGLAFLLIGSAICLYVAWKDGSDFAQSYVLSKMIVQGINPYKNKIVTSHTAVGAVYMKSVGHIVDLRVLYPPSTGVALLPLAFLPFQLAKMIWFAISYILLVGGLWRLITHFAPGWNKRDTVLAIGLVLCASCVRWGFGLLQYAPIMLGLISLFIVMLMRGRTGLVVLIGSVILCLKPTFGVPIFALALLQRRYGLTFILLAVFLLVNLVGFDRIGGVTALKTYYANITSFDAPGFHGYPNPYSPTYSVRLDWPYLLAAVTRNVPRAKALGMLLSVGAFFLVAWEWFRLPANDSPITASIACLIGPVISLSLLSVYHEEYDFSLLIIPLIILLGQAKNLRLRRWALICFAAPIVIWGGLYPPTHLGPFGGGWLDWIVSALGGLWWLKIQLSLTVVIAFIISLIVLHQYVNTRVSLGWSKSHPKES